MLRSFKAVKGYQLLALDGDIGRVHDLYFDDRTWRSSHLVVQSGRWPTSCKVLLSSHDLGVVNRRANTIITLLTCAQVQRAQSLNQPIPVSQQRESEVVAAHGWGGSETPAATWLTLGGMTMEEETAAEVAGENGQAFETTPFETTPFDALVSSVSDESHRRSANEVHGYAIATPDGILGHVADFLVDDAEALWAIRNIVVRIGSWPLGRQVLLAPGDIEGIDWECAQLRVGFTREELRGCPVFDAATPVTRGVHHERQQPMATSPQTGI